VGGLWISGGLKWDIPHHESLPALYALNQGSSTSILAIFVMSSHKSKLSLTFNPYSFLKISSLSGVALTHLKTQIPLASQGDSRNSRNVLTERH
jgi:hypothetical protein